ncbi:MAG: NADH-quinone oxidoreductase subunit N [Chloroflexi bacterium]|nr:MAG: NADH-quinone oxidoreductase subunit N [Chloroflexota bacterium]RLC84948.1 MAG: NADH-quinone oxidoreductase subunit N [Chloroflexota bacterium]
MFGEPTLTLGQTIGLLSPELLLLLAGLVILGLDAISPHKEEKPWLPRVALIGLAAALVATIMLWGYNTRVLAVLSCDPFALMVKMVALVAMGIVILASDVYIRAHSRYQGEFYALLLFSTLAICLLGGATNLIMVYLAFEFLSIISYILTGYLRDDKRSTEAAIKYFLYGAGVSAVMLYGMSWFYGLTGATDLAGIADALTGNLRPVILPALVFVAAGFAFKIGAVPFHQWAPDAYEGAPTPVTAFLSVCPKIAGFAVILRVLLTALPPEGLEILGGDWRALLMAISAITMTFGNLVAMWQTNIKRLLAYSSIAQAGYILIGVVSASERGVTAVLLYLAAYAVTNLGAFAAVIAFSNQIGSDEIKDYAGLHKRAPGLALILIICLLSLAGIPPTAGFVGKLWLFSAALDEGLLWLAAIGVINSVISVSYYWKIIRAIYLTPAETEERIDTSPALAIALGVAVTGVFIVGIFPSLILSLLQTAAQIFFVG